MCNRAAVDCTVIGAYTDWNSFVPGPGKQLWVAPGVYWGIQSVTDPPLRVLLANMADGVNNGLYDIVATGAQRAIDCTVNTDMSGAMIYDMYQKKIVACLNRPSMGTVGTHALSFYTAYT